jgi:hypothetical protein
MKLKQEIDTRNLQHAMRLPKSPGYSSIIETVQQLNCCDTTEITVTLSEFTYAIDLITKMGNAFEPYILVVSMYKAARNIFERYPNSTVEEILFLMKL